MWISCSQGLTTICGSALNVRDLLDEGREAFVFCAVYSAAILPLFAQLQATLEEKGKIMSPLMLPSPLSIDLQSALPCSLLRFEI